MRIVTRADLDGLTSAVLITTMEHVETIELCHPQDVTDKRIEITENDVLANLPYHPRCAKWFDHHELTDSNERPPEKFDGRWALAPSAARVVFDYYKSPKLDPYKELLEETDRLDSASLRLDDIVTPKGWILLGYTIDSRTGLGAFKEYFMMLVDAIKKLTLEEILTLPDVKRRIDRYKKDNEQYMNLMHRTSRVDRNVIVTDLRNEEGSLPVGNRFLIYTLYPECNVSVRVHWGPERKFAVAAIGHNILNRTCKTNVGELCARYGGGGHKGAGSAPLKAETADRDIAAIIATLKTAG
ncbi:MAG: exopolyphosphatase [Acidobacteriota bacterium]